MKNVLFASLLSILFVALVFPAWGCGGSSGGPPSFTPGAPVLTGQPAGWVDVNGNTLIDAGDQILMFFDRAIVATGATPADLMVLNGNLGTSTLTAAGSTLTITLQGATITIGLVVPFTSLDVAAGSNIKNAGDMTSATGGAPVSIMGNVRDSNLNIGSGNTFAIAVATLTGGAGPVDVVLGKNGPNEVWLNAPPGTFTAATINSDAPFGGAVQDTRAITVLDVDNDTDLDFVTGNQGPQPDNRRNRVFINMGGGVFTHTTLNDRTALGTDTTTGLANGDLDGLPGNDLVVVNSVATNIVYFSDNAGQFDGDGTLPGVTNPASFGPATDTRAVAVGQIDGLSRVDIVTVDGEVGGTVNVYLVTGVGLIAPAVTLTGQGDLRAVTLCNLDPDAELEIVVGVGGAMGGVKVYDFVGGAIVPKPPTLAGGMDVRAVTCADLNNDMRMDIVAGLGTSGGNRVYLGLGAFAFQDALLSLGIGSTMGAAAGDANGRGLFGGHDLFFANAGVSNKVWFTGE